MTPTFSSYSNVGYNIRVSPITDASLLALATTPTPDVPEPCPGVKWLEKINEYRRGPYFYSHLTDYLRFCILFKHGGVYSDFDAIQLSKWNHPNDPIAPPVGESFIGADSATGNPARKLGTFTPLSETSACPWCFNGEDKYLAPGVMGSVAGSILVKTALEIGFERTEYDPLVFNAVGPKAVTLAYQELEKKRRLENVQVLKRDVLYPYSYLTSLKVFQAGASKEDGEAGGEALARKGLSLHLYGHKTKGMVPEPGSILDYLVRKQTVVKTNSSILESSEDERETPQHEIHVPRFLGISKYIQEVPDIRVVADVRQLELHYSTTQEFDENILLSLQISARHGRLRLAAVNSSSSLTGKEWNSVLSFQRLTPAAANKKLSLLMYFASPSAQSHIDCVTVTVKFPTQTITKSIPIYILPNLVTVMIKTTDRISKVFTLVSSIRQHYPNMTIIVADDGHLDPSKSTKPEGPQRGFYYLPLPHDVGLSAGRNRMVSKIRTKYVLTLDDDFTVNQDGQIAHLIHALETAPKINPEKQFDIAAGKIPADEGRFGVDYCGLMTASHPGRTLRLDPGRVTPGIDHEGCVEVDFVPNVFVARTQFLRETLQWDETLKLGEHEDFFWRAKQLGARTLTCPGVTFYHDQVEHWKGVTEYDRKRARVFDFFKVSLRKHGFVRLVSFGRTIMDLVLPKPVEDLEATNILSRSVFLTWKSAAASFKILQSSDTGLSWSPINHGQGENYEHEPHRPSKHPDGFQRKPNSENWITVYGLKPGTSYIFRLHAGNRFNFLEAGVEVYLTTLTAEQELG
ncbi:hypothetical protein BDR26DRAFT_82728 [Obelidium mucronatum]|nr:hypothetical protein BDR26DRAFT_82728 [Obelidium mucronatum]